MYRAVHQLHVSDGSTWRTTAVMDYAGGFLISSSSDVTPKTERSEQLMRQKIVLRPDMHMLAVVRSCVHCSSRIRWVPTRTPTSTLAHQAM
jgi:hypothetical protein